MMKLLKIYIVIIIILSILIFIIVNRYMIEPQNITKTKTSTDENFIRPTYNTAILTFYIIIASILSLFSTCVICISINRKIEKR